MSNRGDNEAQGDGFDMPLPEAGSFTKMRVGGAVEDAGEPEMITGEAFAPSLEDLAQDWLAEPLPTASSANLQQEDGSGALLQPEPQTRDYERAFAREHFETEAREGSVPAGSGSDSGSGLASAVAAASGSAYPVDAGVSASAAMAPAIEVAAPPRPRSSAAAEVQAFDPNAALSGTRRTGRRVGLVALVAVALAGGGAALAWNAGLLSEGNEPGGHGTRAVGGHGAEEGALAANAADGAGASGGVAAKIDDDLEVESFEVGLPGKGKSCEQGPEAFSIARDRKLAACYAVANPHEADKIIVVWEKDGETVRRGVRDAPRAATMSSASYLSLPGHETGSWVVKLERVDAGVHTELAREVITIED